MGCKGNPEWKLKHSGESSIARATLTSAVSPESMAESYAAAKARQPLGGHWARNDNESYAPFSSDRRESASRPFSCADGERTCCFEGTIGSGCSQSRSFDDPHESVSGQR
jgi:hypothetical protein